MTPDQRIQQILQHVGMNPKTFAEACGYERPQIVYDVLKGKTRNISSTLAERILHVVPDIDRVWLLTGEGEMLGGTIAPDHDASMVPLIPMSAIAGPLQAYFENGVRLSECTFVYTPVPGADYAMPVTGDSMEPDFHDGSTIYIKRINEKAFIPWGHPLVLDTENGPFLKIVMPDSADSAYIWASSLNPKYPPMHIPTTCVFGMYRVLNVSKTFVTL